MMFEIEKLRLVKMRVRARGNRALLARIDRALYLLTQVQLAGDDDQLAALQNEIDELAGQLDRRRDDPT